jgi:hypothetical protein
MLKNLQSEFKKISSRPKDLKSFGVVMGCFCLLVAGIHFLRHHSGYGMWVLAAVFFLGFALLRPSSLKILQRPWMMLALVLGTMMSTVLLTLLYFIALTPLSLLARLLGKKFLDLEFKKPGESYWNLRTEDERIKPTQSYENQY